MKKKLMFIFSVFLILGCSKEKIEKDLYLGGNWKIISYQYSDAGEVSESAAKDTIGQICGFSSNVLRINLYGESYKCLLNMNSKKLVDVYADDYFNPSWKNAADPKKFNLTSKIYEFNMDIKGENENYNDFLVVDGSGKKMVLGFKGPVYLLEKME